MNQTGIDHEIIMNYSLTNSREFLQLIKLCHALGMFIFRTRDRTRHYLDYSRLTIFLFRSYLVTQILSCYSDLILRYSKCFL